MILVSTNVSLTVASASGFAQVVTSFVRVT
jgi:hypothetical protein